MEFIISNYTNKFLKVKCDSDELVSMIPFIEPYAKGASIGYLECDDDYSDGAVFFYIDSDLYIMVTWKIYSRGTNFTDAFFFRMSDADPYGKSKTSKTMFFENKVLTVSSIIGQTSNPKLNIGIIMESEFLRT